VPALKFCVLVLTNTFLLKKENKKGAQVGKYCGVDVLKGWRATAL
jgi:hypothetical protein